MLEIDAIPFFPFKLTSDGGCWLLRDPLTSAVQEVNAAAYWLLRFCDGYRSWGEVVAELVQAYHIKSSEVIENAGPLVQELTDTGLLWWRSQRMAWWQLSPPTTVLWDFTNRCNLACQHCAVSSGAPDGDELSTKECQRVIDELANFGVQELVFSGGEPLIRRDLLGLAEHAKNRGLKLQVATNGTLITKRTAQRLADVAIHVQVSLDGAQPETHDNFRGIPRSWERATRGIRYLASTGLPVTVGSVVTTANIAEIPALYDLAEKLGARTFRLIPFIPFGRGRAIQQLEVAPDEMQEVTRYLLRRREDPFPVPQMEFECTFQPPPIYSLDPQTRVGCDGAASYCTITATGEVLPCHFFAGVEADNVRDHDFAWIWANSRFLNYFRSITMSDIQGTCQSCAWLPSCRTSCLAANFAHRMMFQSNCHCWLVAAAAQSATADESATGESHG